MSKLLKTAIKWGPVLYPIVKKIMDSRKTSKLSSR
ncbi:hypothetical protein J2S25_001447 [Mesobacillus stamsii]|uniref:Uncharacterized protein n=1 Tax=Mesobacillus stamsii TaxID=225347 RepID=A0ABU0FV55_9BACI|nr:MULTISPECIES: hypothetical protein [Mesobacillus]MDQ0413244.1 hypothetical protein [Mesobacillus stamsii]